MNVSELGPSGRKKNAYTKRGAPLREEPVRAEAVREEPVRAKVRIRKSNGTNPMDLPYELMQKFHADGIDLMWGPNTVAGMPDASRYQNFEINAWEAVTPQMFGGVLDGLFMPKGYTGEIVYGASVLMWRPLELTIESRAEDSWAANSARVAQENSIRGGQAVDTKFDTQHPSAKAKTFVRREVVRGMPVPE